MVARITGISSMATRPLLAELTELYRAQSRVDVVIESVGGVDAAKRVQAGEAFDLVILAADAIDKLIVSGRVVVDAKFSCTFFKDFPPLPPFALAAC